MDDCCTLCKMTPPVEAGEHPSYRAETQRSEQPPLLLPYRHPEAFSDTTALFPRILVGMACEAIKYFSIHGLLKGTGLQARYFGVCTAKRELTWRLSEARGLSGKTLLMHANNT